MTKMYHDMKRYFWWPGMKADISEYSRNRGICLQVKAEHHRPGELLKSFPIPRWKWEDIAKDFVRGLPRTVHRHDSIWVIVDRLTKSAHFIPVATHYTFGQLNVLFERKIIRLHGVPLTITSDRDAMYTSRMWRSMQEQYGTRLQFSTAFNPQTNGQTERFIQTLEDMLRACVLEFGGSWEEYLLLCEFAYNNNYQASIEMAPFEALYGRPCRSPSCWAEPEDRNLLGPEIVVDHTEKVRQIRQKLKGAQERQKKYADMYRNDLTYDEGALVYLKVSPRKGHHRFGLKGKLAPRFIGPFKIKKRVGKVAYELELPPQMSGIHPMFHISMFRLAKSKADERPTVDLRPIDLSEDISYEEQPVQIFERKVQQLRNKSIPKMLVK
ncbi:hypothetical protein Syun_025330 [Stephania yunnanensis]|uniref:Integrase catalytic domain-containing protein n=1 Tax=Stephania yunnanensis TaxID=152371 RepID=A0AAP0EU33_9MAGN